MPDQKLNRRKVAHQSPQCIWGRMGSECSSAAGRWQLKCVWGGRMGSASSNAASASSSHYMQHVRPTIQIFAHALRKYLTQFEKWREFYRTPVRLV